MQAAVGLYGAGQLAVAGMKLAICGSLWADSLLIDRTGAAVKTLSNP
jgi:hypothetical protein